MKKTKRTLVEREQLVEIDMYLMERTMKASVVLVVYKPLVPIAVTLMVVVEVV